MNWASNCSAATTRAEAADLPVRRDRWTTSAGRPSSDAPTPILEAEEGVGKDVGSAVYTTKPPAALLRLACSSGATGKRAATWNPMVPE